MFQVNLDQVKEEFIKFQALKKSLTEIISPFLDSAAGDEKQSIELCQVGKFIAVLNTSIKLISRGESPDFIIEHNQLKIGVEHERILNPERVQQFQSVKKLFDDAAKEFARRNPEIKVLANIHLKSDDFSFTKSIKQLLIDEICVYILGVASNTPVEKPEFIKSVNLQKHSLVSFSYLENNFYSQDLTEDALLKAIEKKNKLAESYRQKSSIQEQWLLLVVGSLSSDSYEMARINNSSVESSFDKIFILEDFNAIVHQIK